MNKGELKNILFHEFNPTFNIDYDFDIEECQKASDRNHIIKKNNGKLAIYMFFYEGECLKIGKVGAKSSARYNSHHYNHKSSGSNLAKSLINDSSYEKLNKNNVQEFIRMKTTRINIVFPGLEKIEKRDYFVLNLLEAYMQFRFNPKYEGSIA